MHDLVKILRIVSVPGLYRRFNNNKIFYGTVVVSSGIFLGGTFAYLLQFLLGRMLSVADFGTFNALLSLSMILGVPIGAFGIATIKVVSDLKAQNRFDLLTGLYWRLVKYAAVLWVVLFAFAFAFRELIGKSLQIDDKVLLIVFAAYLGLSGLNIAPQSYLQGLLRFKAVAFFSTLSNFLRLILPGGLIFLGFGLGGVFGGIMMAGLLGFGVAYLLLRKNLNQPCDEDVNIYVKRIVKFTLPVILVQVSMTMLNNIDVVMVKRYFDPVEAGHYAGVVTIGKILLFGAGTLGVVMYPQISEAYAKKANVIGVFKKFFLIQMFVVAVGVAVFSILSRFVTTLFFGQRFLPSVEYVPYFAVFAGLYVLINFSVLFFLAVEKTRVWVFLLPGILAQIFLLWRFHSSLMQVIYVNIGVAGFLLFCLGVYMFIVKRCWSL